MIFLFKFNANLQVWCRSKFSPNVFGLGEGGV
jgi:hypothetical protein